MGLRKEEKWWLPSVLQINPTGGSFRYLYKLRSEERETRERLEERESGFF